MDRIDYEKMSDEQPLQFIIEESRVFRDRDFGLGMFEDNGDVRCELIGDRVWLMCGSKQVRFGEKIDDDGLSAEDAESIGHVLVAAGRAARQRKEQVAALQSQNESEAGDE